MSTRIFEMGASRGRLGRTMGLFALAISVSAALLAFFGPSDNLIAKLFLQQDLIVLAISAVILLLICLNRRQIRTAVSLPFGRIVTAMAVTVLASTAAGTWLIFADLPLIRDEILADFDAAFLAAGQLIAPIPTEWRPYAQALMPQFMLQVPADTGWMSAYLPGNAALRAIGERTIGMEWVNPVLAAFSIVAIYRIGRRLWPDSPDAAMVAALLAASSAQLLVMAMTTFAMTAHLAFNLVWLWCFLRGDRKGDAGALAAGFVATGLHQLIFHPLFVAPFILELVIRRERARALVYIACYAAIGLFWASYWQIVLAAAGGGDAAADNGLSYLLARILALIVSIDLSGIVTMGFNVARFIAWQNLLLVPLALLAWPMMRRGDGIARPLAGGILLTLVTIVLLLPSQGFGWGYRYLHGLIGSFCLLAGYGWQSIAMERQRVFALAVSSAVTLLLILPFQLKAAHDYTVPRARAQTLVSQAPADIVIIVPAEDLYDGLIRNLPDLSNHPKIMDLRELTDDQIASLCARHRIALFDITSGMRIGLPGETPSRLISRYSAATRRVQCGALL